MTNADSMLGVCLHELAAREEAVINRVISFSAAQGRHYQLVPVTAAQLLVVSDATSVALDGGYPAGCVIIRIAEPGCNEPCDVLMSRPLLVTRVMRALDEARDLLKARSEAALAQEQQPAAQPVDHADQSGAADAACSEPAASEAEAASETEQESPEQESPEAEQQSLEAEQEAPESEPEQGAGEQAITTEAQAVEQDAPESELQSAPAAPEPASAGITNDATEGGYPRKALVIDDSAAIRKQLELELRTAGITADFAESGEQALEQVEADSYDLIFLDIIMPGMDGYETCRQLRARAHLKKTPIIMLSAKTSPLDEVQGVIAGASTYLTKPVRSEQLQQTLQRVAMWLDNFSGELPRKT